jgi:hypothetical protein
MGWEGIEAARKEIMEGVSSVSTTPKDKPN